MNNNINHTSINIYNNNLNNGSNTNTTTTTTTTETTTTTTATADTNTTTTTTTTTTTATTPKNMTNHSASVGVSISINSDLPNKSNNSTNNTTNKNNNNNSNTPLKDLTKSQLPIEVTCDSNVNAAVKPETNESELTVETNELVCGESAKNTNDNNDGSFTDNCNDKYDKFMTERYKHNNNNKRNENKADANADAADREKDLGPSVQITNTATTDMPTITKTTQPNCKLDESNEQTHIEMQRKIASVSNSVTSNNDYNNSNNNGSNGKDNSSISQNFVHDSTVTYNNDNIAQQLLLHIADSHSEEKLTTLRTQQKLRHSQRRLRTKALLDSLPQSLKINAKSSTSCYEALLADGDELLQRMSINNPFYRFRKQSDSLKEMRALTRGKRRRLRKARSETDILGWLQWGNEHDKIKGNERYKECYESGGVIQERYAQVILDSKGSAVVDRDKINYVRDYKAPLKRGETAVQLTDSDGSVVVVLDNKLPNIVCKPKSLSSLEELLHEANAEEEQHATRSYLLEALTSESAYAHSPRETDSSTVITNPFSIFLDDDAQILAVSTRLRTASSASQQQRPLKKRQRSERSIRRLFETGGDMSSVSKRAPTKQQTSVTSARQNFQHGMPVSHFERQDFVNTSTALALHESTKTSKVKSKLVFKNLSLRKLHKSASGLPASKIHHHVNTTDTISELSSLPQLKKLKISYPNRTQSIHSALDVSSSSRLSIGLVSPVGGAVCVGKHSYFERLQAKTRQGLQKLRDKCRNFKQSASQQQYVTANRGFSTLAKDDSFRFIGDRARISSYESKCAALNAHGNRPHATIYKSYKSEIDLSKNLHYLDAYLEENFEQNLRSTKESAHSVGRVAAGRRQEKQNQLEDFQKKEETSKSPQYARAQRDRAHKRSLSVAQKPLVVGEHGIAPPSKANNYENLGTLPIAKRGYYDSLSSSDYASVFSGPTLAVEPATPSSAIAVTDGEITPTPADDTSSSAGLRYEHPKMSQYFFNKLANDSNDHDLLHTVKRHSSSEAATCFFHATSEDELDDEQDNFVHLAAGRDAALLVDYRRAANLDESIRILVNEAEETGLQQNKQKHMASVAVTKQVPELTAADWYQEKQRDEMSAANERNFLLACNENLAESNFYRSLNQHLQQQQQQIDRDLYTDVVGDSEEEGDSDTATATATFATTVHGRRISGDGAGDVGDKDFHYESYLEHFHRAKNGEEARKANSIGYNDKRVDVGGIESLGDVENAEQPAGVYMTRSAFRRAARGRKAGGSAYELRHSALLLLNEHLAKDNERNKDSADMAMASNRTAYYARQFYGVGTDISSADSNGIQEAGTSGGDKLKMPAALLKPFTANSAAKSRQRATAADGLTLTVAADEKQRSERFVGTATQLAINDASNLLTTTATEMPTYNLSALLSEKPTTISGKNDFYYDDAMQNAATISAAAMKPPTKIEQQLNHTDDSGVTAHMYFQQHKQDQQRNQPATAYSAMFIESGKQAGAAGEDVVLYGDASSRYMLDNMRRHYQQQQQQKQHYRQKSTNSVSSSLSLSTSSSSNSSVSQPVVGNLQQQQQLQQQLLLPATKEHVKYMKIQQKQLTPGVTSTAYHTRRSSTASNASSSDNFDTFIALRNAQQTTNSVELASPAAAALTALQTDYLLSTQRTNSGINNSAQNAYQQRQLSSVHAHTHNVAAHHHYATSPSSGGSSGTAPLISALNYYGTSGGSSSISDGPQHAAYASSTASASASASASSSSSSSSTNQRYALNANASAIASNNYALLAQMHYGNKVGSSAATGVSSGGSAAIPSISSAYPSERKPFVLEYEC